MKKFTKFLLGICVMLFAATTAGVTLTSCSEKGPWEDYEPSEETLKIIGVWTSDSKQPDGSGYTALQFYPDCVVWTIDYNAETKVVTRKKARHFEYNEVDNVYIIPELNVRLVTDDEDVYLYSTFKLNNDGTMTRNVYEQLKDANGEDRYDDAGNPIFKLRQTAIYNHISDQL